jgi:pimeloyl-ACP methyl ester carboxylesterase
MRRIPLKAALQIFIRLLGRLVVAAVAVGCLPKFSPLPEQAPALLLSVPGAPSIQDGRARFRQIACMLADQYALTGDARLDCEHLLWRLADEGQPSRPVCPLPTHDSHLRVLIVPGAFAECFPEFGMPFENAAAALRQRGWRIGFVAVSGRSGADHNAGQIAAAVENLPQEPDEKIVLIGHSKGTLDILHFLVDHPRPARRVDAAVSVSGPVSGSPLADGVAGMYDRLLSQMPFRDCPAGDRQVIDSLKRSDRTEWLASHRLPGHVHCFSLATFTRREDMHPLMLLTYDRLAAAGERNDGYVPITGQLIPGATLLGYANLDHWDIALPVRERLNFGGVNSRADARRLLFEALLLTVAEALKNESPH